MNDAPSTPLPHWPGAYPASGASATLKSLYEDLGVTELPLHSPAGEGEHLWLEVEKNGANTVFVAQQLAQATGVREVDVGHAGLKDRHAVARQWFSIHLPTGETPDLTRLRHPEFSVLSQARHTRKLRPGDLRGNRFRIVLRQVTGEREAVEANLRAVAAQGAPNYFGAQRFGHGGGNVEQGRVMLAREIRVRDPKRKGLYLSAVRSFVFNEVLAQRIRQGLSGKTLPGDVMDEAGRPTGPLWGRGRVTTTDQAQALENEVAGRHAALCGCRQHAGLDQERRALVASPADLSRGWPQADQLVRAFGPARRTPGHRSRTGCSRPSSTTTLRASSRMRPAGRLGTRAGGWRRASICPRLRPALPRPLPRVAAVPPAPAPTPSGPAARAAAAWPAGSDAPSRAARP